MQAVSRTLDIVNCARCHGSHKAVAFRSFTNLDGGWSEWAMCPDLNEPILLALGSEPVRENPALLAQIDRPERKAPAVTREVEFAWPGLRAGNVARLVVARPARQRLPGPPSIREIDLHPSEFGQTSKE